ncbi:MAG: hypothetical protein V5A28_01435 [Haloarculaceae archaeon]
MDKQALCERVWDDLEESGVARFTFPPHGRIPDFAGADEAADRLRTLETWRDAETLKANPDETTTAVTTVHERQVVDERVPVDDHDVPLDFVVTPERVVETGTPYDRPTGVDWGALPAERIAAIPVLDDRAPADR